MLSHQEGEEEGCSRGEMEGRREGEESKKENESVLTACENCTHAPMF